MNKGSEVVGTPDLPWFGQWGLRPPSSFLIHHWFTTCTIHISPLFPFFFFSFFFFFFFFFLKKGGKRYELMEILSKIADIPWSGQG